MKEVFLKKFATVLMAIGMTGLSADYAASASETAPRLLTETYGNWTYRCQNTATTDSIASRDQVCEIVYFARDTKGSLIAQIAFGVDPQRENSVISVFQVPQGTLLTNPVEFKVKGDEGIISAPYTSCFQGVCQAHASVAQTGLSSFMAAKEGVLEFKDRSGRLIRVVLSLDGFASAFERVTSPKA